MIELNLFIKADEIMSHGKDLFNKLELVWVKMANSGDVWMSYLFEKMEVNKL